MQTLQKVQADTFFAPAGRDSDEELNRLRSIIESEPLFQGTLDAMPECILILNGLRQLVACNKAARELLASIPDEAIGKRPGELVECVHVKQGPDGCGTSKFCRECGAVNAILHSQREHSQVSQECRIVRESDEDGGALDLIVTATSLEVGSETYTICFIKDISHSKRLDVLTRMFFHDVLNTLGGIKGIAEMLADRATGGEKAIGGKGVSYGGGDENLQRLLFLSGQLVEEIQSQRDLMQAESGALRMRFESVDTTAFLGDLCALYEMHAVASHRAIKLDEVWEGSMVTDRKLLARVVGNMLKNALEATELDGEVKVGCKEQGVAVAFHVWNSAVMPEEVQHQIFQRSFSTKAKSGRGIGTHSMKLLGETYLGGQVSFTSKNPEGTTFTLELPKVPTVVLSKDQQPAVVTQELPQTFQGRVLLAEDGPDNQRLILFVLKKLGLEVDLAENGRIAYEMALESELKGAPYDLILMDIEMPELNGKEATQQLRQHGWQGPILALTALDTKEDFEKCLEAGCNNCVHKPLDRTTFLTAMAQYLKHQ